MYATMPDSTQFPMYTASHAVRSEGRFLDGDLVADLGGAAICHN
jgi:hypothetical protein